MGLKIYPIKIGSINIVDDDSRKIIHDRLNDEKISSYEKDNIVKACLASLNPYDDDNLLRIDQNLFQEYSSRADFLSITLYDSIAIADSEIGYCWKIDKRICIKQSNKR